MPFAARSPYEDTSQRRQVARHTRNADLRTLDPDLHDLSPVRATTLLSVIIPTLNERDNIAPLLELLTAALPFASWEVIFVDDDSRDGTADCVRAAARRDPRVRCVQRIGRRGLATACMEGVLSSAAPYVAVMDADLQHDERLLPQMLALLDSGAAELVIGSRYVDGGGVGDWKRGRARISKFATRLAGAICKTDVADPMSGFFMCRREVFERAIRRMSGQGFKILLDLLASSPTPVRVVELPYVFRQRQYGESKLDILVAWEYGMLLADKLFGGVVPIRFVLFALIGGVGLVVNLAVLWAGLNLLGFRFAVSQAVATMVAMTSNFFLNNQLTYRDLRLRGRNLLRGLMVFYLICGFGAIANVGVASYVFAGDRVWWLAGIAGAVIGAVWNFAMSSVFTWKRR
ncbi:MAG TPA: glycosyltransferase family 2 protein [Stellaceae bacterium]|jgi:dolichol-phosphate mannosyltransferase|nr:glycosyltransferase family 2 protein [Stellaceae bacterium]